MADKNKVKGHSSRILLRAKISDYKLKKIIRCYAEGLTAAQTHQRVNVSATRIYAIYKLIRKRMILLGAYPDAMKVLSDAKEANTLKFRDLLLDQIAVAKSERRGITDDNFSQHAAEIAYRALLGDHGAQHHYDDIMLAIKYTGPLNAIKPPTIRYGDIRVLRNVARMIPRLRKIAPQYPEAKKYMDALLDISENIERQPGAYRHRDMMPEVEPNEDD